MFVIISVALLFADAGSAALKEFCKSRGYSISLSEGTIAAQAGLCVVLPCSFTTDTGFNVAVINWSKYDGINNKKIFNSRTNKDADSEFKGRVSLLDSDLQKKNCSIIINDLRESDSGSYELRVINDKDEGYSFKCHANITVTALCQRPTVMIPPLTEGQQTTLTCTAPGLCSGSVPEISWKWKRPGSNETEIRGNITDFQTENLTAVTQKHSSTLTFDPSAEHHGTEVTCEVRFMSGITTEEAKTLIVTYPFQLLKFIQDPKVIIAFLIGLLIGAFIVALIACLVRKSQRKQPKRSKILPETLEMVTTESLPPIDAVGCVEDGVIHTSEPAEEGDAQSAPDGVLAPKEVEYSDIDFSKMKSRSPTEAVEEPQNPTKTEYAEIKKEKILERQDDAEEDSKMLEANEEEVMVTEENKKTKTEGVGGEEVALYSNLQELIGNNMEL
ncbi:sialic acid-binding Ig-like lectin 11 [Pholidichthys leucotaenia]